MKFLELFKFFPVKTELLNNVQNDWVDFENVEENENGELPDVYICRHDNKAVKYIVLKKTSRLELLEIFNISWFDKISYIVVTDFEYNGHDVVFETKRLDCMDRQIDLHVLLEAINDIDDYCDLPVDEYDEYDYEY